MEEKADRRSYSKRLLSVLILIFFTMVVLVVSTYAWFLGAESVSTSEIILNVSAEKGLEFSLDGVHWEDETLTLSEGVILGTSGENKAYAGHKNKWATNGLKPISSRGEIDSVNGRLKLYSKASITATVGGYRFRSALISNSTDEKDGYVAFDLFIKNASNGVYKATYDAEYDEAVYLTRTSKVIVTPDGAEEEDYGLANSVRLAFMQVGRVNNNVSNASTITGIGCTGDSTVTGLCAVTTSTIWEPNNRRHNIHIINHYNETCKIRTGIDTYTTECDTFSDYQDVDTYVVKEPIASSTKTNVYDGHNSYTSSSLENIDTFTDTKKLTVGQTRVPFMFLSPSSITKVRVYIYLEGQDIDNYDLISNGNTISITFGFTKNPLSEEEDNDLTSQVSPDSLYYKVMSQASNDKIDFHYHSSSTGHETNGVYKTNATEDGSTVYYYRGDVDNHVIFNDMCWRIVRTTETGGVKLIYNGLPSSGQCTATGANTQIGTSAFNDYSDNAYVGYMYGAPGSSTYEATHANINDSTIKQYIDDWYSANFTDSSITSKIEDTVYCNDRSTVAYDSTKIGDSSFSSYGTLGYGVNSTLYGSMYRSSYETINPSPSLVCSQDNDKFTVSSENGNGALTYPVGLITNDEAIFAGFNTYTSNTSDYMDTNNYLYAGTGYWTFSPVAFNSDNYYVSVGIVDGAGGVGDEPGAIFLGVRPAISLVDGILVGNSGDGSSTNPYVVE